MHVPTTSRTADRRVRSTRFALTLLAGRASLHGLLLGLLFGLLSGLLDANPAAASAVPLGDPFEVSQGASCALADVFVDTSDAGIRIVWQTEDGTLRTRSYDDDGVASGPAAVLANDLIDDLAAASDGRFVTVQRVGGIVQAHLYASNGILDNVIPVSPAGRDARLPAIDLDEEGHFVVVWNDATGPSTTLEFARFDVDGTPLGVGQVATSIVNEQAAVALAPDALSFVVAWEAIDPNDPSDTEIYARPYDTFGVPILAAFPVSDLHTDLSTGPSAAADTRGRTLVAWSEGDTFAALEGLARTVRSTGPDVASYVYLGGPPDASPFDLDLAMTRDQSARVTAWENVGFPTSVSIGVGAQIIHLAPDPTRWQGDAAVAIDDRQRATVVWREGSWDPNDLSIGCEVVKAQRFQLYEDLPPFQDLWTIDSRSIRTSWRHFRFPAIGAAAKLTVDLDSLASGFPEDVDLYLRVGDPPTLTDFDCRSFQLGPSSETCTVSANDEAIWVTVIAYDPGPIDFTLTPMLETGLFFDGFESGNMSEWSAVVP